MLSDRPPEKPSASGTADLTVFEDRLPAENRPLDSPAQPHARIGRHLMAMEEAGGVNVELGVGIPDDEIGVATDRDAALDALQTRESGGRRRHPFGQAFDRHAA